MAVTFFDNVKVYIVSKGLDDFEIGGAVDSFLDFDTASIPNGAELHMTAATPFQRESFSGIYDSTAGTVSRATIYSSTSSDAKVDFADYPVLHIDFLSVDALTPVVTSITIDDVTVNEVVTEAEGLASADLDTSIATTAAIIDFISAAVTAEDLDFSGDSGTGAIDLDTETFAITTSQDSLVTAASGNILAIALADVLEDIDTIGPNTADNEFLVGIGAGALAWEGASTARGSLGVAIGSDVQAWSAILDATTASFLTADETKLDYISVTQAVDLDAIETRVNALDAAVVLQGTWDASAGTFPGGGTAQAGDSYIVSVGGTVDSEVFTANDRIIAITDNASTSTYASNWHKADYTDEVVSVAGKTGAVTLAASDIASGTLLHERGGLEADVSAYAGLLSIAGGATGQVNTKAGLEALLSDVANFAEADGDTYSGTHNFASATISLPASAVDAITEIASGLKSGADLTLITGTAGASGAVPQFNADGDLVTTGAQFSSFALATGDNYTGAHIFAGSASLEIPNGTGPTVDADGEIALDTLVTDWDAGLLKYYSGEVMGVVAMPIAEFTSPSNGAIPTYNSTTDEFEMSVSAGGGIGIGKAIAMALIFG